MWWTLAIGGLHFQGHRSLLEGKLDEIPLTCLQYYGPPGTSGLGMVTQNISVTCRDVKTSEIREISKNYKNKNNVSEGVGAKPPVHRGC
jgi:hypothetical protein